LAGFNGLDFAGDWTMNVSDRVGADTGTLLRWCLEPTIAPPVFGAVDDSYSVAQDGVLTVPAPGVLDNDNGSGLTASLVDNVTGGVLNFNADGSFDYTP